MLDEHGLNRVVRQVGVDGLAAEQDKALKAGDELLVGLALFFNNGFDGGGDLRNAAGKVRYGGFPFLMLRLTVLENSLSRSTRLSGSVMSSFRP
ncbi:MAG: hypothetical protein WCG81_13165, partial [Candidatus Angelobacter sp.]